jgi:hypothetical protein
MLLFRGLDWDEGLSPEEIQNVMVKWDAWFDRLTEEGKAIIGQPLTNDGRILSGTKGLNVVDGPFVESKEAVAGYILLRAANLVEATNLAKECPGLDYEMRVEIRPISDARGRGLA